MPAETKVKLFQLRGAWGAPSISPFCIKLETHLRLARVPFESAPGSPLQSPSGKVPWIEHGGERICDSQRVVEHLARTVGADLDAGLSASEQATSHALRRMLEAGTYFGLCWLRWISDEGFAAYKPILLTLAPPGLGHLVLPVIRRDMKRQVRLQGTSLLTAAEVNALVVRDFAAVDAALGDKPFLFGDTPTSLDAVVFAFVESLLAFPVESEAKRRVREETRLDAHRARVRELAY